MLGCGVAQTSAFAKHRPDRPGYVRAKIWPLGVPARQGDDGERSVGPPANAVGSRPAVARSAGARDLDRSLTFGQWNERSCRLANALLGIGLDKGDRFAMLAYNSLG
ncbi:AMP-binding protein [Rhodopila sp.]|uniref:AMP-binding protein n=1 Tax=Rhodopila sp. TaxID=2480087 RepID=UPI003D13EEFA